ncbi:MAG: GAF domain-containing protein, partial [Acidobacteria bacterium]|nr:GAF domain-containing protein [Acidobacteriota bacterium]
MNERPDELRQQIEALQERVSRLSAAILRISASLDLDTVLQEAVDSARALTGARYGAIATVDEAGRPVDFVTSGFTPDERQEMAEWPDGPRLFEHLRNPETPLRLADLPAYVKALGFSSDLMRSKTLQGAPMRHRGVYVGSFFLAEKESGGEFRSSDEEVQTLFASQAATAIANARTHRDERRARSDLETLVETSPVGVVVFDVRTGRLVTVNREVRRITERLRSPDGPIEELLQTVIWRRGNGPELALAEFPLVQQLGIGETVRAEEFTLSVPGRGTVKVLINATPILTSDGEVGSYVITIQDLAPLEELERQRAEFLGLVSHELRAPLISIKGSTATVLGAAPAPDPAEMLQFFRVIDGQANHMRSLIADLLDQGRIETGTLSVSPEPAELAGLVDQARSTFLSGGGRHTLRIDLPEDLPRVLVDRGRTVQVLNNLLANAARHSPESSAIVVTAALSGVHVAISVSDEGRGVPPDRLPHLFSKQAGGAAGDVRL